MKEYQHLIGKKVSFKIKPTYMRNWVVVDESDKCLHIKKETDEKTRYYLSKKIILEVIREDE